MIESEIVLRVLSNVMNEKIFSEEIDDYATLDIAARITEENEPRNLEDGNKRLLE